MVMSKSTCPKWYFGQVGHGGKNSIGFYFKLKFLVKKFGISCSDWCYFFGATIKSVFHKLNK